MLDRPTDAPRFDTITVHAGDAPDRETGALEPSVVLSNAYAFEDAADAAGRFSGTKPGAIYARWENPTVARLEQKLAAIEGAEDAAALASGMAAVHAAIAACVSTGDHVVAAASMYAETGNLLREHFGKYGVATTFVDATDPAAVAAAIREETRVVYLETPSNPTLAITDVRAVAAVASGRTVVVDSTFATPYHQRPLAHGADLVVHSATKGLAGHGDVLGGVVAGAADRVAEVRRVGARLCGGTMSPLAAMLVSRGVRTLSVRMARASASAMALATRLEADPRVERVFYPGLASHSGHAVATRQMERGFGALVAFEVAGGRVAGARLHDGLRLIARAVSLGDVRSLLTHSTSTTHASWTQEARAAAGIGEGLVRMSVGIEDVEDLWADLDRALG